MVLVKLWQKVFWLFPRSKYNLEMLSKLKTFGLNFKDSSHKDQNLILEGKIFVLTGSLTKFNREEATLMIEALGGKVFKCIKKQLSLLLDLVQVQNCLKLKN